MRNPCIRIDSTRENQNLGWSNMFCRRSGGRSMRDHAELWLTRYIYTGTASNSIESGMKIPNKWSASGFYHKQNDLRTVFREILEYMILLDAIRRLNRRRQRRERGTLTSEKRYDIVNGRSNRLDNRRFDPHLHIFGIKIPCIVRKRENSDEPIENMRLANGETSYKRSEGYK